MKKQIYQSIAAAICVSIFSACAGGTPYSEVKSSGAIAPRNGKGMVLIYRTPGFVSAAYKPYLYVNGVELPSRLPRGGFYSYEAAPGPLSLAYSKQAGESTSKTKTHAVIGGILTAGVLGGVLAVPTDIDQHRKVGLDITVVPNETRFIVMGGAGGPLKEISKETGEEEIESCHWLNPAGR